MNAPEIPVSWGELIDKITILEIKLARLENEAARSNVWRELNLLRESMDAAISSRIDIRTLTGRLAHVNEALWEIEDRIREKELQTQFDNEFIELARSVYKRNDERAAIKREINVLLNSEIIEEKSYHGRKEHSKALSP